MAIPRQPVLSPWAARYADLRQLVSPGLREPDWRDLTELEWQSVWFAGEFGREFVSTRGRKIEVVQFGHWNHAAGPDFTDAVIRVDGEERRGAVELDRDARDWERHGHADNPAYEEVVLHLFLQGSRETFFTRTSANGDVPQVLLRPEDLEDDVTPNTGQAEARLGRCSHVFHHLPTAKILAFLRAASHYRLELKARRLARAREAHGLDQAIYQGIAEALGYRPNKAAMRVLAQRLLLKELRPRAAREIDALLFGVAGFLEGERHVESADDETREYQRELWSHWWAERSRWAGAAARPLPWKLSGVRPTNHPQRRLAALSVLAAKWNDLAKLASGPDLAVKSLTSFLTSPSHPYWDHHYTLRAARSTTRMALLGKERALDILANHLFPLRLNDLPDRVWRAYEKLPAMQDNEKIRRATVRLFGDHPDQPLFTKYLHQQQAVLQVYDDFCLADATDCAECPFPEQLLSWTLDANE